MHSAQFKVALERVSELRREEKREEHFHKLTNKFYIEVEPKSWEKKLRCNFYYFTYSIYYNDAILHCSSSSHPTFCRLCLPTDVDDRTSKRLIKKLFGKFPLSRKIILMSISEAQLRIWYARDECTEVINTKPVNFISYGIYTKIILMTTFFELWAIERKK